MQHQITKKILAHNLLKDSHKIAKIVEAIDAEPSHKIVEIGPGSGALTDKLVERLPNLTVIEIDQRMTELLREKHPDLDIIHQDILKTDRSAVTRHDEPVHVIGNLPYYITN